jgi:hypothetical protein
MTQSNNRHSKREKSLIVPKSGQQRAYRVVITNLHHSVQHELVRKDIEQMGHKIGYLWNIWHRVTGNPLSLFFLHIEAAAKNSERYYIEYLQNMSHLTKIKIIYHNARVAKRTPQQGVQRTKTKMRKMHHKGRINLRRLIVLGVLNFIVLITFGKE